MFMNSNSLPIALLQSLVVSIPNLHWGSDDTPDAMVGRALTYLVLCSTLGMMVYPYLPDFRLVPTLYHVIGSMELWCPLAHQSGPAGRA